MLSAIVLECSANSRDNINFLPLTVPVTAVLSLYSTVTRGGSRGSSLGSYELPFQLLHIHF